MSQSELRAIYQSLLDTGDLKDMFPHLSGNWEKDKNKFSSDYLNAEYLGEDLDFDDYEEDNYYDGF